MDLAKVCRDWRAALIVVHPDTASDGVANGGSACQENYGAYVNTESSASYNQPQANLALEYQSRMAQLGFRVSC